MATKRKSIIEEALLEAKSLEDALKANTKEILASHMKEEIETIVESSLKEQEDEELEIDVEEKDPDEIAMEEPTPEGVEDEFEFGDETEEVEDDVLDLDAVAALASEPIPDELAALDLGDEEVIDLTDEEDDDVIIKVFKKLDDTDEVEVVKDDGGITLTDNETGAEYYIKESEELYEDQFCEGCGGSHVDEDSDEIVYEIELDEKFDHVTLGGNKGDKSETEPGHDDYVKEGWDDVVLGGNKGDKSKTDPGEEDYVEEEYDRVTWGGDEGDKSETEPGHKDYIEEEELEENQVTTRGRGRYSRKTGKGHFPKPYNRPAFGNPNESRKSRKPISERRRAPKNISKTSNSKIVKEYKELKTKNNEYKEALKLFKDKLNEVALFNTNLAYVNRLFTEHSTTKKEKMGILKRFDNADSVKNSKSIYKTIKNELDIKTPINESVENKVNRTVIKSSASDLNESTAYVDPQIAAIKDLMKRIS